MMHAEWCYDRQPVEKRQPQHGRTLPAGNWTDLNQNLSFYFYELVPYLDVALELVLLCVVWSLLNLQQVPSLTGFLALRVTMKNVVLLAVCTAAWSGLSFGFASGAKTKPPLGQEIWSLVARTSCGALLGVLFVATSVSGSFGWMALFYFWVASLAGLSLMRVAVRMAGNLLGAVFSPVRQCLIVGSGARALRLSKALEESSEGRYHVIGFVDRTGTYTQPEVTATLLGPLDRLGDILKSRVVDEALIALPLKSCYAEIQRAICTCEEAGVPCKLPHDPFSYSIARPRVVHNGDHQVISLDVVRNDWTLVIKRALDIVASALGLIVLAPGMSLIALAIWLGDGGPVIFRQRRYGLTKRTFMMYKFRTMWKDAEARQHEFEQHNEMSGPVFKIKDDPRITPIGRFLRRTSLDELPQLWNVLAGSMSLVGPRPLPERDVARFSDAWLMRRFSVKPGLTCLWQISGRNQVDFDRWIELDLRYIDNWSLRLDARILLETVAAVLRGEGAA